jgi:hypothetical protein
LTKAGESAEDVAGVGLTTVGDIHPSAWFDCDRLVPQQLGDRRPPREEQGTENPERADDHEQRLTLL